MYALSLQICRSHILCNCNHHHSWVWPLWQVKALVRYTVLNFLELSQNEPIPSIAHQLPPSTRLLFTSWSSLVIGSLSLECLQFGELIQSSSSSLLIQCLVWLHSLYFAFWWVLKLGRKSTKGSTVVVDHLYHSLIRFFSRASRLPNWEQLLNHMVASTLKMIRRFLTRLSRSRWHLPVSKGWVVLDVTLLTTQILLSLTTLPILSRQPLPYL